MPKHKNSTKVDKSRKKYFSKGSEKLTVKENAKKLTKIFLFLAASDICKNRNLLDDDCFSEYEFTMKGGHQIKSDAAVILNKNSATGLEAQFFVDSFKGIFEAVDQDALSNVIMTIHCLMTHKVLEYYEFKVDVDATAGCLSKQKTKSIFERGMNVLESTQSTFPPVQPLHYFQAKC